MDKQRETSYFKMKENTGSLSLRMLFVIVTFISVLMLFCELTVAYGNPPLEVTHILHTRVHMHVYVCVLVHSLSLINTRESCDNKMLQFKVEIF